MKNVLLSLTVIFGLLFSVAAIYKFSDEDLTPEAKAFYSIDADIQKEIEKSKTFIDSIPKPLLDRSLPSDNICSAPRNGKDLEKVLAERERIAKENNFAEALAGFISVDSVVFSQNNWVEAFQDIDEVRNFIRYVEHHVC